MSNELYLFLMLSRYLYFAMIYELTTLIDLCIMVFSMSQRGKIYFCVKVFTFIHYFNLDGSSLSVV